MELNNINEIDDRLSELNNTEILINDIHKVVQVHNDSSLNDVNNSKYILQNWFL